MPGEGLGFLIRPLEILELKKGLQFGRSREWSQTLQRHGDKCCGEARSRRPSVERFLFPFLCLSFAKIGGTIQCRVEV